MGEWVSRRRLLTWCVIVSDASANPSESPLGVRHALLIYTSPSRLFRRVEDTGAYGWSLVTLLGLVMLIGYVQYQTGLLGRLVDERTEVRLASLEADRGNLVDRIELRNKMEEVRKEGEFLKTLSFLQAIVGSPVYLLASFLLISSLLYAVVALTGRTPEYHTLMSICVFAGFIELVAYVLRTVIMVSYRTLDIDTSLKMLSGGDGPTFLAAIDPFRIWFWGLVAVGLVVTQQLSRRMAFVSCGLLCLLTTGVRIAWVYGMPAA